MMQIFEIIASFLPQQTMLHRVQLLAQRAGTFQILRYFQIALPKKKEKKKPTYAPTSTWECLFSPHPIKTSLLSASTKCCSLVRLSFSDQSSVFLFSYLH